MNRRSMKSVPKTMGRALILFVFASVASAIIIRHDRDDAKSIEMARQFGIVGNVKGGGAATVVGDRWLITAGHVAAGLPRSNPTVNVDGRDYSIERAFVYPGWKDFSPHDVALLKTTEPIEGVTAAQLYKDHDENGQLVVFVGYGKGGNGKTGPTGSDGIKRAATNKVERVDDNWLFFTFHSPDSKDVTELEGISGPNDSGGPALIVRDGRRFVAGVSVWGDPPPEGKGHYGQKEGYTRVSTHLEWLEKTIQENSR
jgi:hypothetical protein